MYAYFEGFPVLFGQRLFRNSLAEEAMSFPLVPGTDLSDIPAQAWNRTPHLDRNEPPKNLKSLGFIFISILESA